MEKPKQGSEHWNAAFDDDTVREIRAARLKTPRPPLSALAAKYNTSKQTIASLVNRKTYRDVE